MGNDNPPKPVPPTSRPPDVDDIDEQWDDEVLGDSPLDQDRETAVSLEDHEAHNRITAVPELPTEQYVAQIMREAERVERSLEAKGTAAGAIDRKTEPAEPSRHRAEPLETLELDDLDLGPEAADPGSVLSSEPPSGYPQLLSDVPDSQAADSGSAAGQGAPRREMQNCYAMGDFSGALSIAERLLALDPSDVEAARYASSCQTVLIEMYTARLGALDSIATACVPPEQVRWLSLDHRAGFILSLVDDTSSVETLLDISGMARLDTLRILVELLDQGVISLSRA